MGVKCVKCQRELEQEQAIKAGWTVAQKAAGAQGELYVLCERCKTAPSKTSSATMDVQGAVPFAMEEKKARLRKRGKHGSD